MGKPESKLQPANPARRPQRTHPTTDTIEEFHAARRVYNTLAWRSVHNKLFLPRTLRRSSATKRCAKRPAPIVVYASSEPAVDWVKAAQDLQCLWCKTLFFRFMDEKELLLHLRTCHGRFVFSLGDAKKELVDGVRHITEITVYMRLQRGLAGLLQTEDKFHAYDMENTYVNRRRYPKQEDGGSAVGTKRSPSEDDGPSSKRHRPMRTCAKRALEEEKAAAAEQRRRSAPSSSGKANGRTPSTPRKRVSEPGKSKTKSKVIRPKHKLAYTSVEAAVREKKLFHSVMQHPVSLREIANGDDSDDDTRCELEWRQKLDDDEVLDYVDTIPIEKLFMNLWNQFLKMEFFAYADRRIARACLRFATKYRRTIHRLNFEVTFLRHLTEMSRIGLIDADTVHSTLMLLRDRDPNPKTKEEEEARFLFEERINKEADKLEQQQS